MQTISPQNDDLLFQIDTRFGPVTIDGMELVGALAASSQGSGDMPWSSMATLARPCVRGDSVASLTDAEVFSMAVKVMRRMSELGKAVGA
jgi:hypothetical protein